MADEPSSDEHLLTLEEIVDLLGAGNREAAQARPDKLYATIIAEREATLPALAQMKDLDPLDPRNRDPSYWTPERKQRLRAERTARLGGKT